MLQIKNTLGGGKPEGLYVWKKNEIGSELKEFNKSVSTLPYNFCNGSVVVLDGEIHILGGYRSGTYTKHYKWNGESWLEVSTLPYNFDYGSAVIYNNEIHILGGTAGKTNHYKWNGSSWTSVSTLPYSFYDGSAVVINGEIHILGSASDSSTEKYHYKWNGSSWISVSTLPYSFYCGSAVVFNNEIHILGSLYDTLTYVSHYKWNGSSWTSVSTLPYKFYRGSAVVLDNEIHILGGEYSTSIKTSHYKWDGSSWTSVNTLPYSFYNSPAVIFDNGIHTLGSGTSDYSTAHYLIIGYAPVYTFIDYIVSDKETAYPDGGEKDGYYYERVSEGITPEMFGCTKIAVDTVTFASDQDFMSGGVKYYLPHSLGEIPKQAILWAQTDITTYVYPGYLQGFDIRKNVGLNAYVCVNWLIQSNNSFKGETRAPSLTADNVFINGGVFKAGVEYKLITMA